MTDSPRSDTAAPHPGNSTDAPGTRPQKTGIAAGDGGRRRVLANLSLSLMFASLLIDGFPPGAAVLREFGARPTDFLLVLAAILLFMSQQLQRRRAHLTMTECYVLLFVGLVVPLINFPVAVREGGGGSAVVDDWVKQYLMFAWGVFSYYVWKALLRTMDWRRYCNLAACGAVIPVLFFFLEYFDTSGTARAVLDLFRTKQDLRPSSFATEPAIYAAWIGFLWPLLLYSARQSRRALVRSASGAFLALVGLSAYLSEARTFAVLLLLQLIYMAFWSVQKRQSWGRRIRYFLFALCALAGAIVVLAGRLLTLDNLTSNGSNIARFAYTYAAVSVSLAHPLMGIGIGQFGHFFPKYVPRFALMSREVMKYASGDAQYRTSTFNLFVRLCCEFGIPLGLALCALVVRPLLGAARSRVREPFLFYAALSAVGGAGFWLSQDPYGYQPGILSLSVLAVILWERQGEVVHASQAVHELNAEASLSGGTS